MKKMIIGLVLGMMIGSATVAAAAPGTVQAVIAKLSFFVDGQSKSLKSAPLVYNGTTYLPVREVSGMLGYDLDFNSKTNKINFTAKGDSNVTTTTNTSEWVQLRDIAQKYNLTVGQFGESLKVLSVKSGETTLFKVDVDKLTEEGTIAYTSDGHEIHLKMENGFILVNSADLKNSGVIQ
ncbi:hypothetical protein D3C73_308700 [compost metagenome]